jgi:hypothetical protein
MWWGGGKEKRGEQSPVIRALIQFMSRNLNYLSPPPNPNSQYHPWGLRFQFRDLGVHKVSVHDKKFSGFLWSTWDFSDLSSPESPCRNTAGIRKKKSNLQTFRDKKKKKEK